MSDQEAYPILFSKQAIQALQKLANEQHISVSEALSHAIANELELREAVKRDAKILIREKNGKYVEVVFK